MTHAEAIELIKSGGNTVRLLVRRGKMPPSASMGNNLFYSSEYERLQNNCQINFFRSSRNVSSFTNPFAYFINYKFVKPTHVSNVSTDRWWISYATWSSPSSWDGVNASSLPGTSNSQL